MDGELANDLDAGDNALESLKGSVHGEEGYEEVERDEARVSGVEVLWVVLSRRGRCRLMGGGRWGLAIDDASEDVHERDQGGDEESRGREKER
jgi:hypothetical protein